MQAIGIVAEYNPFHNGHQYHIAQARAMHPADGVIAVMSGNFTQRGEFAVTDKSYRAKAAVECGVNLVLELPFPYSMSSAEFFAKSGVSIADRLGFVDYLVFGSECGDIGMLSEIAKNMLSEDFFNAVKDDENEALGYPQICEKVYKKLYDKTLSKQFFSPNNILAIEYIKAIYTLKSKIIPITIKREGGSYDALYTEGTKYQSATAVRDMLYNNLKSAFDYVPENAKKIYREAIKNGAMPTDISKLDTAVIAYFRLNSPKAECNIHDASGGLYNRLYDNSMTVNTINSLVSVTETKKYIKARIKRAVWNSYFGVTSSAVKELPEYTQVLAMDAVGRSLLKRLKEMTDFTVLTKPASYKNGSPSVIAQKELSNKADSVFDLALNLPISGVSALRFTPYVKK